MFRKLIKYGKRLIVFALLFFVVHTAFILVDGFDDEHIKAEYAVVLGNKVEMDGKPSEHLRLRLDKAIEIYGDGLVKKIIVSGGIGREGFQEADIMRLYLEQHRIPVAHIIADGEGYTTYKTAQNATKLIGNNETPVIVVSHYYHITRTKLAFSRFGMKKVYGAHADFKPKAKHLYAIFREFIAYYYYLLRPYR